MKRQRVLKHEFIGREVEVNSLHGKIIDETKNIITIKDEQNKIKKIIKKNNIFKITIDKKTYIIDGKEIEKRPEERTKLSKKK